MTAGSFEIEGKSFPVSHQAGHIPVHLLGWDTDLDHKTPHVAARAPQSMLQELLNRDDARLWAIVSNGATLRLLRDSAALTGSAYVEFDLQAVFDGELFSDFVLLYLVCHESRFAVQGDGGPHPVTWNSGAASPRTRASGRSTSCAAASSRPSPSSAPASCPTRPTRSCASASAAASSNSTTSTGPCCGLVYRMLFWFVAEERRALLQPDPENADDQPDAGSARPASDMTSTSRQPGCAS